jgi:hypothetical protein
MTAKQPYEIVTAAKKDLLYVEHLGRYHSNNIGFVPRTALADHIQRGNVRILRINGHDAGYMLAGGGKRRPYRLIQIAISTDLWRLGYGSCLIADARRTAAERPMSMMTATIRDGLPMLAVAERTGARRTATHDRPTARKRPTHDYLWPAIPPLLTEHNCLSVLDSLAPETDALLDQRPSPPRRS